MRRFFLVLALFNLTGCLTLSAEHITYTPKDPEGLLAVWAGKKNYNYVQEDPQFQLLRVEKTKLQPNKQMLVDCSADEFKCIRPTPYILANASGRGYAMFRVEPGIYAVLQASNVDYGVLGGGGRYGKRRWTRCYYRSLEFLEIPAGQVSTIDVGEMYNGRSVSDQAVSGLIKKNKADGITASVEQPKVMALGVIENSECGRGLESEAILTILPPKLS